MDPREALRAVGRRSRALRLTLAFLGGTVLVGLAATLYALVRTDPVLRTPTPLLLLGGVAVLSATVGNLLLRFLRWQFLLRRFGLRLPAIPSLGAYVGSFAFLPVPLYLGQLVARIRLLPGLAAEERRHVLLAFVCERAFDVGTLAILAAPVLHPGVVVALLASALLVCALAARQPAFRTALHPATAGASAAISLLAWLLVVAAIVPLGRAAGAAFDPVAGTSAAASAILLGGVSLVPLGAGVSGLFLIAALRELGTDPVAAAQITFVFRVATAWFSVILGAIALRALWSRAPERHAGDHFDAIDDCYDAWLPSHYRRHLVAKKTGPMRARLARLGAAPRGVDVGCGRGWYVEELARSGARMVGVDTSALQLAAAGARLPQASLVRASVLGLPFRAAAFDFAYVINVLHHLPSPDAQRRALGEIGAVVRPGGFVFVHEMSVRNPLFRFYLSYVFPLVKGIEEGTEYYLDPHRLAPVPGLRLVSVDYFTFIPDFVPARLLALASTLERRLEQSGLARYGAHFVAVYERVE